MSFFSLFMAMAKLFLMLLVGFYCHKWKVFPESAQTVLTKLVIYVAAPCTIVSSVYASDTLPSVQKVLLLLGLGFGSYLLMYPISVLLTKVLRVPAGTKGVYINMLLFSNCVFIGLPVVQSIFGAGALLDLAIFSIPFNPCLYGPGVLLMMRDNREKGAAAGESAPFQLSTLLSPCMVASIIAIALAITKLPMPNVLLSTMSTFSGITTPGALLVIGISIAKMPLKSMLGTPRIYVMSAFRLVIFPVLIWALLRPVLHDPMVLGVCVVVNAMPVAATIPMLTTEYGSDTESAVQGVFITTVLSMLTIPVLATLLL